MRKFKFDLEYLISLGLACAFLAGVLRGFFEQENFNELIESSFFSGLLSIVPYFIYIVAFNDFIIAAFLILRIFPKIVAWWATFWLLAVIAVHLSELNLEGLLDGIEHIALLTMAIFLVMKSRSVDSPSITAPQSNTATPPISSPPA